MSLTKGVLAVVFALLSAAGAQTRAPGDSVPPAAAERGARSVAAFDRATVAGSVSVRIPPIPTPTSCPTVDVSCPDVLKPGEPVTIIANISGGDPAVTPTFKWTVSTGTITSGQGTGAITVAVSGAAVQSYTATVEVGGYDPACTMSSSCTLMPGHPVMARKVDEYGSLRFSNEKSRLNNFAKELQNDPTARGYFICYGGRRGGMGEVRRRCERAKSYLVNSHGVDPTRVVADVGGRRAEPAVEFWVVPSGAEPPRATPPARPGQR